MTETERCFSIHSSFWNTSAFALQQSTISVLWCSQTGGFIWGLLYQCCHHPAPYYPEKQSVGDSIWTTCTNVGWWLLIVQLTRVLHFFPGEAHIPAPLGKRGADQIHCQLFKFCRAGWAMGKWEKGALFDSTRSCRAKATTTAKTRIHLIYFLF